MKKKLFMPEKEAQELLHSLFPNNQIRDFIIEYSLSDKGSPNEVPSAQKITADFQKSYLNVFSSDEYNAKLAISLSENRIEYEKKMLDSLKNILISIQLKQKFNWKTYLLNGISSEKDEIELFFIGTDEEVQLVLKEYSLELSL